jgi:hypothetical protein
MAAPKLRAVPPQITAEDVAAAAAADEIFTAPKQPARIREPWETEDF